MLTDRQIGIERQVDSRNEGIYVQCKDKKIRKKTGRYVDRQVDRYRKTGRCVERKVDMCKDKQIRKKTGRYVDMDRQIRIERQVDSRKEGRYVER